MSPASRWHLPSCIAPDITVFNGCFLWCRKCASLFNPHDVESLCDLPVRDPSGIPTLQGQEMSLSWPLSVSYRPKSPYSNTCLNEVHREPPRHTVVDHDNPTALKSYVYDYGDLTTTDEVRILELSKGKLEDPLHGTLTKCRLQNFAAYEALSYTWANHDNDGLPDRTFGRDIIYLGPFWDAFLVTRNCSKALRRLRYPDRTRVLWVDSICINQENEGERSHQVWLMQRIYENALSVVVYLGYEDSDSSIALGVLRTPERLLTLTSVEFRALKALFQRPYFSRLWIVQEVALAKSLHFYCGSSETFIPLFSGGTLESLLRLRGAVPAWMKYSSLRQSTAPRSLWSLLQDTNSCRCSDPRDKLFGILSLVTANSDKELKPDYSLSVEEVYTGIAAFLIREVGLLPVLELAARTPKLNSLPSWAPNWAACSINSSRWTSTPFPSIFSLENPVLDSPRMVKVPLYSPSVYRDSRDPLDSYVSVTGTLTVKGMLIAGHASNVKRAKHDHLLLQNDNGTLYIAFYLAKMGDHSAHVGKADRLALRRRPYLSTEYFILNHQSVFLLAPYYSQALVLEPIDGEEEFTLLAVGEIVATICSEGFITLPESLCLLPLSAKELTFARNGVISRPDEFPLLRDLNLIWSKSQIDPVDYCDQRLLHVIKDLLSRNFRTFYETEARIWAKWQRFEKECMSTFLDPAKMESIADYIRSLKGSSDWNKFRKDAEMVRGIRQCRITNFFSLFILDPQKRCDAVRDMTIKGDHSNEDIGQNDDPKIALDGLLDWEICMFDLLRHIQRTPGPIEVLPGEDLLAIARKTWDYYSSVAKVVCRGNPGWDGWYTWFMAKKVARQHLETKGLQGEDSRGGLLNRTYWDWDHMKTTMEARGKIWAELIEFRRRFEYESGDFDLDLLVTKLGTRRLMKEVGYNLGYEATRDRSVTIR